MEFEQNQKWPPLPAVVDNKVREWDAWYSGDPSRLNKVYGGGTGQLLSPALRVRASQYAGGVVGAVSRAFWGQPPTFGNPRAKAHMPLAADLATLSADLLFGEAVDVTAVEGQKVDRLETILKGNLIDQFLPEAAHAAAGLGGVYLRSTWDKTLADHVLFDALHADHALPEWSHRKLKSVTFWEQLAVSNGTVTRYLETHERGRIRHRVYEGTADKLGRLVPLDAAAFPQLAGIELTRDDYFELPDGLMTVTYVPNKRPAGFWRNDPVGRHLGEADVSGIEPLLGDIDEVWNTWMRELRLGKARVMVARQLLESGGIGQGLAFDLDREIYEGFTFMQGEQTQFSNMIQTVQPGIRYEAHKATLHEAMVQAVQTAGYSPYTFGLGEAVGGTTATEVDSRDSRTNRTRERKSRYWTPALEEFFSAATRLDAALFGGVPVDAVVEFPAGDVETPRERAQTLAMIRAAQASSVRTRVEYLHPEWAEEVVDAEVARIYLEEGLGQPEPGDFMPDTPPADDTDEQPADTPEE